GLACTNSSGTVTDYWTTNITFTASKSDPNGFVWSAFQFTSSSTLNPAKIGSAYTDTVTAAGGTTPYKWKATGLPKGLKMSSSTGTISGTASKKDKAKAYPISVTCTDKAKAIATGTFSLTLDAA
ncbi:MAG: putative Ig domain-containing protein, partial [Acidimicrobiales bacterium]